MSVSVSMCVCVHMYVHNYLLYLQEDTDGVFKRLGTWFDST